MSRSIASIRADIQALSPSERGTLITELIHDLDGDPDSDVESAWLVEINQRLKEIESGAVQMVPADDVFARIRSRLKQS